LWLVWTQQARLFNSQGSMSCQQAEQLQQTAKQPGQQGAAHFCVRLGICTHRLQTQGSEMQHSHAQMQPPPPWLNTLEI
jgi:hypothetical protein